MYSLELATAYPSTSQCFKFLLHLIFDKWDRKGLRANFAQLRVQSQERHALVHIATFVTSRILPPFGELFSAPQNKRSKERRSQRNAAQQHKGDLPRSHSATFAYAFSHPERGRVTHSAVHACSAGGDSCVRTDGARLSLLHK